MTSTVVPAGTTVDLADLDAEDPDVGALVDGDGPREARGERLVVAAAAKAAMRRDDEHADEDDAQDPGSTAAELGEGGHVTDLREGEGQADAGPRTPGSAGSS